MRAVVAAVLCVACQGQPAGTAVPGAGSANGAAALGDASAASDAADSPGSAASGEPGRGKSDDPELPDPGRVIAELGAIPAWQAVIDRAQLLGRRGQHGVVYGRIGPAIMVPAPGAADAGVSRGAGAAAGTGSGSLPGSGSGSAADLGAAHGAAPAAGSGAGSSAAGAANATALVTSPYVWLIDDTEGNGALGIRIALGDKAKEGDRIAAGGAWQLDAERRWFWKPDAIQPLPPAPPGDLKEPPPAMPSHAIAAGPLPPGARTIGVARDNDVVYFQIAGPPPSGDGDGWQVADQLGSPTVLVMNLPGERPSYGGQDMRSADERWQLRRAQTYWVRIGKLHRRGDKPPTANARTAPVRVP